MRRRLRAAESGAMAVLIALVTCFVIVPLGALAVDIGMQRIGRSDAQAIADVTALNMARALASGGTVSDAAATVAAAQSSPGLGTSRMVHVYTGTLSSTFVSDQSLGCNGSPSNAYFTQTALASATAVLVTVTNSVKFAINGGSGGFCRSAIGQAQAQACFHIGSYAAAVRSGNSTVLGPLLGALGGSVNTSVLSYQGLASMQLKLAGLASALGVGTPTALLATNTTVGGFLTATATALTQQGDAADASVVTALGTAISASVSSTPVNVGQLLSLTPGGGSALSGTVNALDLVTGVVNIADGTNAVSVPGLNVNIPGVTSASTSLSVIEPPRAACGRPNTSGAAADTAQIRLNVTASVLSALPSVLGLGVAAGPISINVQTAQAHGQLTSVSCGATKSMNVQVTPSLLPATIIIPITVTAPLLGSIHLTATLTTIPSNPASSTVTLTLPTNITTGVSTPSGNLNVSTASIQWSTTGSTGLLGLLGITLGTLTNALTAAGGVVPTLLSTVVTPVLNALTPLLETSLGLTLAGADLWADSVNCTSPGLAG